MSSSTSLRYKTFNAAPRLHIKNNMTVKIWFVTSHPQVLVAAVGFTFCPPGSVSDWTQCFWVSWDQILDMTSTRQETRLSLSLGGKWIIFLLLSPNKMRHLHTALGFKFWGGDYPVKKPQPHNTRTLMQVFPLTAAVGGRSFGGFTQKPSAHVLDTCEKCV